METAASKKRVARARRAFPRRAGHEGGWKGLRDRIRCRNGTKRAGENGAGGWEGAGAGARKWEHGQADSRSVWEKA